MAMNALPLSPVRRSGGPPRLFAPRTIIELLTHAEEMGSISSGEILLTRGGDVRVGSVFVEGQRIAWAAAVGLGRRLTDLLRSHFKLGTEPAELERLLRECQQRRVPLGETLVTKGLVEAAALRTALRQHTVESLTVMMTEDVQARWVPRQGGYSARFTFDAAEILATCGAATYPIQSRRADDELDFLLGKDSAWAAGYLRTGEAAEPVVVALRGEGVSVQQTLDMGAWAAGVLDLARAIDPSCTLYAGRDTFSAGVIVAWRVGEALFVACLGETGFARFMHRRTQGRRTDRS